MTTFTATCVHCSRAVFLDMAQLGEREVHAMQHHLLRGCSPGEMLQDDLGRLFIHFRVTMTDRAPRNDRSALGSAQPAPRRH